MATYKTPGVYVEEISTLPPSVAGVATAIPAFIGYTERAQNGSESLINVPTRITSLLEYKQYFGGADTNVNLTIDVNAAGSVTNAAVDDNETFFSFSFQMESYFANGGGPCYIVAVGDYSATAVSLTDLEAGLEAVAAVDEPTLLVVPEAPSMDINAQASLVQQMLAQCNELGDRFAIVDVRPDGVEEFRNTIGTNNLKYGAAYYPYIKLNQSLEQPTLANMAVRMNGIEAPSWGSLTDIPETQQIITDLSAAENFSTHTELVVPATGGATLNAFQDETTLNFNAAAIATIAQARTAMNPLASATLVLMQQLHDVQANGNDTEGFNLQADVAAILNANGFELRVLELDAINAIVGSGNNLLNEADLATLIGPAGLDTTSLAPGDPTYDAIATADAGAANAQERANLAYARMLNIFAALTNMVEATGASIETSRAMLRTNLSAALPVYSNALTAANNAVMTLPPSAAVAGVYAGVDRTEGVWKAPANVSLNAVTGPAVAITNAEQEDLNVDPTAGKSINAIRSFTGKGTLIWGARTLAGNDNEWRYIPVRRLFTYVEESAKKATENFVFAPNTANTWVMTRVTIENFLTNLWEQGALAGATPEDAFFVRVGLGQTMTAQDVLEGRMNIEIGMAAVRPAEFIVLKFSHKLQEA